MNAERGDTIVGRLVRLETKMEYIEQRVDSMARALWAAAGSLVVAAVTFALAVASGQIG